MSLDRIEVKRIRVAVESSFGTDMTSDVANNFVDLRMKPAMLMPDTQVREDETMVQRFYQDRAPVRGPERGTLALEAYWTSHNEPLIDGQTPTKRPQSTVQESILGGYEADEGSTAAGTPTTTVVDVATGHGSRFPEGKIVGVEIGTTIYPRLVATRSTDELTLWPALPSAPSASDVIYNSQMTYLDESAGAAKNVLAEAAIDRGNIFLLRGAQGDLTLNLPNDNLLTWGSSMSAARRDHDDEITTPQGGGAIAAASYVDSQPIDGAAGGVHFGPAGATTLSMVRVAAMTFNTGVAYIDCPDHAGLDGVGGKLRDRQPTTFELTILKDADDGTYELYRDAWRAGTEYGLLAWWGNAAGRMVALCAPTAVFANEPTPTDFNGYEAIQVSMRVFENNHSTDFSTAIRRSRFYLAQL